MEIKDPYKRLYKFWGFVDNKHIETIAKFIKGEEILDLGCGYGTTTAYISKNLGKNCTGVDNDEKSIDLCKKINAIDNFILADAENLPFKNSSFNTIILRDSLHHFYMESDFNKIKSEIMRVAKNGCRIIFFDPNVNTMIKLSRKLIFHNDAECDYKTALQIAEESGLSIVHKSFNTVISLPLSGGYVGINFVPDIEIIKKAIIRLDMILEKAVNYFGLGKHLCWRYLIVAEKISNS